MYHSRTKVKSVKARIIEEQYGSLLLYLILIMTFSQGLRQISANRKATGTFHKGNYWWKESRRKGSRWKGSLSVAFTTVSIYTPCRRSADWALAALKMWPPMLTLIRMPVLMLFGKCWRSLDLLWLTTDLQPSQRWRHFVCSFSQRCRWGPHWQPSSYVQGCAGPKTIQYLQ